MPRTTYTASLTSSVVDYPTEYGRRYHAFRQGDQLLSPPQQELDRLDLAHKMMLKTLSGRLYLAPLEKDKVRRIFDIGTGTGMCMAVEMGDCFPNAEIIGNDLSPIQTPWVPPNVKFEIDDVESSWVGVEKYDYIFCRYIVVALPSYTPPHRPPLLVPRWVRHPTTNTTKSTPITYSRPR
ncbi:methyltransferase [Colletotrichum kahawae]|uniref:Methyltransferase n=1 Tax=Colletotrichum kahawae TaxID=34407 RepID=A0AAD9Y598_COLKA|nr:methyltransferase [Colletotrichum kahawae]